jgi:hypothetical protein
MSNAKQLASQLIKVLRDLIYETPDLLRWTFSDLSGRVHTSPSKYEGVQIGWRVGGHVWLESGPALDLIKSRVRDGTLDMTTNRFRRILLEAGVLADTDLDSAFRHSIAVLRRIDGKSIYVLCFEASTFGLSTAPLPASETIELAVEEPKPEPEPVAPPKAPPTRTPTLTTRSEFSGGNSQVDDLQAALEWQRQQIAELTRELRHRRARSGLIASVVERLPDLVTPISPAPLVKINKDADHTVDEDLVVHCSDSHADQVVESSRVNGHETYNLAVAFARGERFMDTTIKFTQETLSNYRFKRCYVLAYGDHVNGEIHNGVHTSSFSNTIANTLAVGQLHAQMWRDLSAYFNEVVVLYLNGNHGRRAPKKDYANPLDNWDYLVAETARQYTRDSANIQYLIPNSFTAIMNIRGYNFHIQHGDDIASWAGIPWYGIERDSTRVQAMHAFESQAIHYNVMGHFHQLGTAQRGRGELILNGSWKRTDDYTMNRFKSIAHPQQIIHGVHDDHGVTWRLPVRLDYDGDVQGPKRYKLEFASGYMQDRADRLLGA